MSDHPFIRDLAARVSPSTYDGRRIRFCLVGQLGYAIGLLVEPNDDEVLLAALSARYILPEYCLRAIYLAAAYEPYRLNLEAALDMARRTVAMALAGEFGPDPDYFHVYALILDRTEQT